MRPSARLCCLVALGCVVHTWALCRVVTVGHSIVRPSIDTALVTREHTAIAWRQTLHGADGWRLRTQLHPVVMKSLTDESIERITELIIHDAQMVVRTAQGDPRKAYSLARESAERRLPILSYVAEYRVLKCKLSALEAAISSARVVAPWTVDDLSHDIALAAMRLARHKRKLRSALKELTPVVRGRLLRTARERPALIPSLSSGLVRSGVYKLRWRLNKWFGARRLRSDEAYERTRTLLVDKWLARAVDLHRMANPQEAAVSLFMRTRPRLTPPRRAVRGDAAGRVTVSSPPINDDASRRRLLPPRSMTTRRMAVGRVVGRAWPLPTGIALWFVTRRAALLVAFAALTIFRGRALRPGGAAPATEEGRSLG